MQRSSQRRLLEEYRTKSRRLRIAAFDLELKCLKPVDWVEHRRNPTFIRVTSLISAALIARITQGTRRVERLERRATMTLPEGPSVHARQAQIARRGWARMASFQS